MIDLTDNKTIIITGGAGLLGQHVVDVLHGRGVPEPVVPRSDEYDLRYMDDINDMFRDSQHPDKEIVVIHLAANVGGIGYNQERPGELFYDNAIMGLQMMEASLRWGVEKFVSVGTVCSYPRDTAVPFKESDLWAGYPEETNAPYGIAKKMQLVQAQAYRQQYGFNAIHLLPVNLYGPGDNFNPASSHVIPALIRRFYEAKRDRLPVVTIWGDGTPTREFLYVRDAAEAIARATERYDAPAPMNLGSGQEISIQVLAGCIAGMVGYDKPGAIEFDRSKPNGQPRRCLDTSLSTAVLGPYATTTLRDGLAKTIQWYQEQVS